MNKKESLNEKSNTEIYEEMEIDNSKDIVLLNNKTKKKMVKHNYKIIISAIIIIIIIMISILLYLNRLNRKKSFEINLKPLLSLKYDENNKIRNRKSHIDFGIHSISCFPSGNLLAYDYNMIIIYDINFNLIQELYAFEDELHLKEDISKLKFIINIEIIDENNFIIITNYGSLNLYTKEKEIFLFKKEIIKNENISSIAFDSKGNIFSLSNDSIKIFEKKDDENYIMINKIIIPKMEERNIYSYLYCDKILLSEDKNILILKQTNSIKFFDIKNNYSLIYTYEVKNIHMVELFDDDKLIVLYNLENLEVISIYNNKVYKKMKLFFETTLVKYFKDKKIIILETNYQTGNIIYEKRIIFLRSDNFKIIQSIEEEENDFFVGLFILNNGIIGAYSYKEIKTWILK